MGGLLKYTPVSVMVTITIQSDCNRKSAYFLRSWPSFIHITVVKAEILDTTAYAVCLYTQKRSKQMVNTDLFLIFAEFLII